MPVVCRLGLLILLFYILGVFLYGCCVHGEGLPEVIGKTPPAPSQAPGPRSQHRRFKELLEGSQARDKVVAGVVLCL